MSGHQRGNTIEDEYLHYIKQETTLDVVPLKWWLEEVQQKKYPSLSKMAVDLMTIPAMSADPERVFSGCKLLLTQQRNRLGIDLTKAFTCLRSWYKVNEFVVEEALDQYLAQSRGPEGDFEVFEAELQDPRA